MRTTALTAALLLAVLMVVSPTAQSFSAATHLMSWEAAENGVQDPAELRLDRDDLFEDYYFQLKPQSEVDVAVGFVEVTNTYGDFVCRGFVSHHFGTMGMMRKCPDLELERTYIVTWITDRPGTELVFAGYGPQ